MGILRVLKFLLKLFNYINLIISIQLFGRGTNADHLKRI